MDLKYNYFFNDIIISLQVRTVLTAVKVKSHLLGISFAHSVPLPKVSDFS